MAKTHATRTVQKAHNCLTRAIRQAEGQDLVRRNVSALVDTPRGREGRPSHSLTLEQATALLAAARRSRLHAYIALCLLTGIRSEEARALTWDHVDLEAGTVSVWRSVRAHGDTKTERSRRTLKLPQVVVDVLRQRQERQAKERAEAGELWQEQGLVLCTSVGTPLESHNLRRDFRCVRGQRSPGPDRKSRTGISPCSRTSSPLPKPPLPPDTASVVKAARHVTAWPRPRGGRSASGLRAVARAPGRWGFPSRSLGPSRGPPDNR
jgi:integrase